MAYKFPGMYKAKDAKSMSRTFQIIAYPESMPASIDDTLNLFNLDKAAYILHDCDFTSDGESKKSHYHIYIKSVNPVRVQTVADRFGIKVEQIPAFKNIDTAGMIEYWLHENDETKTLYSADRVVTFGCSVDDLRKGKGQKMKEDETEMVRKVMAIVKQMISEGNFDNFELIERCCAAGCYSAYRRDGSFRRYLENAAVASHDSKHLDLTNFKDSLGV